MLSGSVSRKASEQEDPWAATGCGAAGGVQRIRGGLRTRGRQGGQGPPPPPGCTGFAPPMAAQGTHAQGVRGSAPPVSAQGTGGRPHRPLRDDASSHPFSTCCNPLATVTPTFLLMQLRFAIWRLGLGSRRQLTSARRRCTHEPGTWVVSPKFRFPTTLDPGRQHAAAGRAAPGAAGRRTAGAAGP